MIPLRRLLVLVIVFVLTVPAAAQTIVATDVAEEATDAASQPKIARDRSGGVHLTFVKPSGGFDQIYVASSTDNGRTWRLHQVTNRGVHSRYPTLAAGPEGGLHLAWTQYEPVGRVYYARFDGGRWSTPLKISPGEAYAGVPAIVIAAAGEPHLVWYGIRDQAPPVLTRHASIYEILYTGLVRGRWSGPTVISPGIPDSINPALGVDSAGTLHSAWYQFELQGYQVQYARRAREWELPQRVSSGEANAFAVALAVHRDGGAYLVWERRTRADVRIFFAERQQRWSGPQPVSPEGQGAFRPSVAVDDGGRVYIAWESEGQLLLRRRTRQWLGTERIASDGKNTHPILAAHGAAVDLMWTQEVGGRRHVRFAPLADAGGTRGSGPGLAALILIALAAMALWQWRRRSSVTAS